MATRPIVTDPSQDITACDRETDPYPWRDQPHGLLWWWMPRHCRHRGCRPFEDRLAASWLGLRWTRCWDAMSRRWSRTCRSGQVGPLPPCRSMGFRTLFVDRAPGRGRARADRAGSRDDDAPWAREARSAGSMPPSPASSEPPICPCCSSGRLPPLQQLTGFDRVMLYRFLDEDAGRVVAEARSADLPPSSITISRLRTSRNRRARSMSANRTRSIPDVDYVPAPIRPEGFETLDLSDVGLRSVSPIHVQYLKKHGRGGHRRRSRSSKMGALGHDGTIITPRVACRPNCAPPPLPGECAGATDPRQGRGGAIPRAAAPARGGGQPVAAHHRHGRPGPRPSAA